MDFAQGRRVSADRDHGVGSVLRPHEDRYNGWAPRRRTPDHWRNGWLGLYWCIEIPKVAGLKVIATFRERWLFEAQREPMRKSALNRGIAPPGIFQGHAHDELRDEAHRRTHSVLLETLPVQLFD
jgi:hypothetical protein